MEPLEGSVKFGIQFSLTDKGIYKLGITYENTKMYWKAIVEKYGEGIEDEPTSNYIILHFVFCEIQIGKFWRADK